MIYIAVDSLHYTKFVVIINCASREQQVNFWLSPLKLVCSIFMRTNLVTVHLTNEIKEISAIYIFIVFLLPYIATVTRAIIWVGFPVARDCAGQTYRA